MKKHNRLLRSLLALVVIMTLALPMSVAAATPVGDDGQIIISAPAGHVLTTDDFNAYKLFTLVGINTIDEGEEYVYEPSDAVVEFLKVTEMAAKYAKGLEGAAAADEFRFWLQTTALDEDDVVALAKDLAANAELFTAIEANENLDEGKVVFAGLDYGYYLVLGESRSTDHTANVISRGMLINVPDADKNKVVRVALKADVPTIEKEVWYHDLEETGYAYNGTDFPANGNAEGWQEWTDVNTGDTVYFKLKSSVPDMTGYEKYTYIVHDTLSPGLTFDRDTAGMQVQLVKDGKEAVPLTNYTVDTAPVSETTPGEYYGGTKIEITFADFEELFDYEDWDVEIIYKATLNEDAVVGNPGNPNKVKLVYSNNPYWDGEGEEPVGETPEDEVRVFTFDLGIFKYSGDLKQTFIGLAGAEFQLARIVGDEEYEDVYFVRYTENGYDYRVVSKEERAADLLLGDSGVTTDKLISGDDGWISVKGLDAGEYRLKETKAPDNYNLISDWITEIIITKDDNHTSGYKLTFKGEPVSAINVLNNTGGQLPGTGGIGTYIFFVVGGIMAVLLVAIYALHRKKKALDILDAE